MQGLKRLKRLLYVLLALSCMSFALADDDFTLRSGIKFGDTMEDILAKETTLVRTTDESNFTFTGKIAGYDDAGCIFYFDDDGKLIDMDYTFINLCTSKDTTNDVYKKLYQSLVRQYGSPLGNTNGSCSLITGKAMEKMWGLVYFYVAAMNAYTGNYAGNYIDYDEWIVEADGYHVKIDLISYYIRDADYKYYYYLDLSYHYFTDADAEEAINKKQSEQAEIDSDL